MTNVKKYVERLISTDNPELYEENQEAPTFTRGPKLAEKKKTENAPTPQGHKKFSKKNNFNISLNKCFYHCNRPGQSIIQIHRVC